MSYGDEEDVKAFWETLDRENRRQDFWALVELIGLSLFLLTLLIPVLWWIVT